MARKPKYPSTTSSTKASAGARTTTVSFSAAELAALGRLLAAGQVLSQSTHPVVGRLKAAMTRLGVPTPVGL
jgi:hypothetical protein